MEAKELRIGNYLNFNGQSILVMAISSHVNKWDLEIGYFKDSIGSRRMITEVKPIPLTEEWLEKFGFEKWGNIVVNEFEYFERFVLYNVIGGTSNFEVHIIHCNYGGNNYKEIIYSIDLDERMHFISNTEYIHTLQNTFALTGTELEYNA